MQGWLIVNQLVTRPSKKERTSNFRVCKKKKCLYMCVYTYNFS